MPKGQGTVQTAVCYWRTKEDGSFRLCVQYAGLKPKSKICTLEEAQALADAGPGEPFHVHVSDRMEMVRKSKQVNGESGYDN